MKGSTYKCCSCREPVIDDEGNPVLTSAGEPKYRQLGAKCPKLRRSDGSWNPRHGTWYAAVRLPVATTGGRPQFKRGGFERQGGAQEVIDQMEKLFTVLDEGDRVGQEKLTAALADCSKKGTPLPRVDEVRRRYAADQPLDHDLTVGQWLDQWLDNKVDLRKNTRNIYAGQVKNYLKPHLADIPIERLRVSHVNRMYRSIEAENERIRKAKASDDLAERATVKERRPVGPTTMHRINATLSSALEDARKEIGLGVNVARLAKLPRARKPKPLVWTDERVRAWRSALEKRLEQARYRQRRARGRRRDLG